MNEKITAVASDNSSGDFFEYWDSLGFFENIQMSLPPKFFLLFEIARLIFTSEKDTEARSAVEEIIGKEKIQSYDRQESIHVNRMEKTAPLGDNMDIDKFRTIYDLKKALPRELVWEDTIFNMKLFTRSLLIQKFYEAEEDQFRPISTTMDEEGKEANRFEQKFFLLLDRSRSMEKRMRAFYSKCIVAEFLRRKLQSNAKIFYRAFDSGIGSLVKIEKKEDFPALIEKVLFTTTGGTGTNMQAAIFQAIKDINYDKEMVDAEILVVTDGIVDDLQKGKLIDSLKDIKLNILKIGKDLPEPNYYDMKNALSKDGYNFDPHSVNINEVQKKLELTGEISGLSPAEKRIYRYLLDSSNKITNDLKEVAKNYIEIGDIKTRELFIIDDRTLAFIEDSVKEFIAVDFDSKPLHEQIIIYKKTLFLSQYVEFLLESGNKDNSALQKAFDQLTQLKQRMLGEPHLLEVVLRTKALEDSKKIMKQAKKDSKKKLEEMRMREDHISNDEIRKAQIKLTSGAGKGETGFILRVLLIKLWELIKKVIRLKDKVETKDEDEEKSPIIH